jgi:hypothetical protein
MIELTVAVVVLLSLLVVATFFCYSTIHWFGFCRPCSKYSSTVSSPLFSLHIIESVGSLFASEHVGIEAMILEA